LEGWCNDKKEVARFVQASESVRLSLVLVQKWTLDPSGRLYFGCQTVAEIVKIFEDAKVTLMPWIYGGDANWRRATLKSLYRDNGFTGQIIGMTDGGMREGQRSYNTVAETWDFMAQQARDHESVGLFNVPQEHRSLRYALSLYA
jgi:hypothetical protein